MADDHTHYDGLEQQRQALEAMSSDLSKKLQAMIWEQEQRAHDFNSVVPNYEESIPEPEPAPEPEAFSSYTIPSISIEPPTPSEMPPQPPLPAQMRQKKAKTRVHTVPYTRPPEQQGEPPLVQKGKDEGSIGGVGITCIIIAVYLFIQCCS